LAVSLDYDGDDFDDLICYHPGAKIAHILKSDGLGSFLPVYADNSSGFESFDLSNSYDRIVTLRNNGDRFDDVLFYRPGGNLAVSTHSNSTKDFLIDFTELKWY
jgi:hypothetical protein